MYDTGSIVKNARN